MRNGEVVIIQTARWTTEGQPSFIREILKVIAQPGMISFAGGLPAGEMFPAKELAQAFQSALGGEAARVLQYSATEGDPHLREALAAHLQARHIPARPEEILPTNGSQHGLDLIAKALLDPGDVVLVEEPTYLGALQAFRAYRPRVEAVPCDEEGIIPTELAAAIASYRPKLLYLIPTFQNPRGTSMGAERRAAVAALCREAGVALVEDDPYGELRYRGTNLPGMRHFWDQAIYLGSFSKIMAPGMRLGWVVAPEWIMPSLKQGVQATCLNVGALIQQVALTVLSSPAYGDHLAGLCSEYGERMHIMLDELQRYMPAGSIWSEPEGGLFIWVILPPGLPSMDLFHAALEQGVAFVPGQPFFVQGDGSLSLRLNFSSSTPEQIREGMSRLGRAVEQMGRVRS